MSSVMLFADSDGQDPAELRAAILRHSAPENEVPVSLVVPAVVLGRTDDLAVLLWAVREYSCGLDLEIRVVLRHPDTSRGPGSGFFDELEGLLVGVELPDGSAVVADGWPFRDGQPDDPRRPQLARLGGGGGGSSFLWSFWLTPRPAPGDLAIVTAAPTLGLAESRYVVAADLRPTADAGPVELWPWELPSTARPEEPRPPQVPAGGWFARALRVDGV